MTLIYTGPIRENKRGKRRDGQPVVVQAENAGRGTFVAAERSRRMWSEVVLVRDLREVSGNVVFQAVLTSERSRRTRVGEGWLLVQVKRRSRSGVSTRQRSSIVELNKAAS